MTSHHVRKQTAANSTGTAFDILAKNAGISNPARPIEAVQELEEHSDPHPQENVRTREHEDPAAQMLVHAEEGGAAPVHEPNQAPGESNAQHITKITRKKRALGSTRALKGKRSVQPTDADDAVAAIAVSPEHATSKKNKTH